MPIDQSVGLIDFGVYFVLLFLSILLSFPHVTAVLRDSKEECYVYI